MQFKANLNLLTTSLFLNYADRFVHNLHLVELIINDSVVQIKGINQETELINPCWEYVIGLSAGGFVCAGSVQRGVLGLGFYGWSYPYITSKRAE